MRKFLFRFLPAVLALLLGAGVLGAASPAQAWWARGGYGYHGYYSHGYYGPGYYGPGIVIGPPVIYAPPPVYYAPTPQLAGGGCYAGAYVCPLDQPTPAGASCSCPVNGNTRVFGSAR